MTHYEVLGVASTATPDEIRKAFRELAHQTHPDKNPGDAGAAKRFQRVREAYEALSDPAKRAAYDGDDMDLIALLAEVFWRP